MLAVVEKDGEDEESSNEDTEMVEDPSDDGEIGPEALYFNVFYGINAGLQSSYVAHSGLRGVCGWKVCQGRCPRCFAHKPAYAASCECGYLDAALGVVCAHCNMVTDRYLADGQRATTCRSSTLGCPGDPSSTRDVTDEGRTKFLQTRDPG